MGKNTIWCWAEDAEAEGWAGPFSTRSGAIADAKFELGPDPFVVAQGFYPDPEVYVADAFAVLIERALEDATDSALDDYGDAEFELIDDGHLATLDATMELTDIITAWARKNVKSVRFAVDVDTVEEVTP